MIPFRIKINNNQYFHYFRLVSLLLLASVPALLSAKSKTWHEVALKKTYIYRLYLNDKNGSPYRLNHPEAFLSTRSLERRKRQGIAIDSTDLPVSPTYLKSIRERGLNILGTSKWHNTVLVASNKDNMGTAVRGLPFVKRCLRLYVSPDSMLVTPRLDIGKLMPNDSTSHTSLWRWMGANKANQRQQTP